MLKDKLQICLITYNRKKHLEMTLNSILADNSPIKDFDIMVLDNASTDGSSEMIDEYCKKYSNLKHHRRKINIGGNANICRAFEYGATRNKDYFWVLCDDDILDWSNWKEVENAIVANKYDLIFTSTWLIRDSKDIAQLLHQATFIPGCIYSSKRLTEEILQNMYNTINSMFCQTMLSSDIICNTLDKIYIVNKPIVIRPTPIHENDGTLIRGRNREFVHPYTLDVFWHIGFIDAMQVIKDNKQKDYIVQNVRFTDIFDSTFYEYILFILNYNCINKNGSYRNIINLFLVLNLKQKFTMLLALINYYFLYQFVYFYKSPKGTYVKVLNKIKIRLYSSSWFKNIFSITNQGLHKIITLLGVKIKIKRKSK